MAEIALVIERPNQVTKYEDGDILLAMNDRRILNAHTQYICHAKKMGFTNEGLREVGCLLDKYQQRACQYKFQRVSEKEVMRITLATGVEELISNIPNAKGEYMDVPAYITHKKHFAYTGGDTPKLIRIKNKEHKLFGTEGHEYWYGGKENMDMAKLDDLWLHIEERTPLKKADHRRWNWTERELKKYLVQPSEDFNDEEQGELMSSIMDEENKDVIKYRKNSIEWRGLPEVVESHVLDRNRKVDMRDRAPIAVKRLKKIKKIKRITPVAL